MPVLMSRARHLPGVGVLCFLATPSHWLGGGGVRVERARDFQGQQMGPEPLHTLQSEKGELCHHGHPKENHKDHTHKSGDSMR